MLKKRIIPILLLEGSRLVKTKRFLSPVDVGDPIKSAQVYSDQDADELVLLHVCRQSRNVDQLVKIVEELSRNCYVPLSVGGGIKTISDAKKLFDAGADKIVVNSVAYSNPNVICDIASTFGRQAVVASIDVNHVSGSYELSGECGLLGSSLDIEGHLKHVISLGAGEILVQAIHRDGTMTGLDINLLKKIKKFCDVPLVFGGGAGSFMDLKLGFDYGVEAVACGSLFNFGDNSPLRAKAFLRNHGIKLKKI